MSNTSCPSPFVDAALFPRFEGYVEGRLCATLPLPGQKPGAECCLPCPVQNYALHPSILEALHWNDIVNVMGVGVGAFVLLVYASCSYAHDSLSSSFRRRLLIGVHSAFQFPSQHFSSMYSSFLKLLMVVMFCLPSS
jgi:hypothetical protein